MTAGTTSIRAQSHSLTPLAQLLSLCQRYRLPLSLLAIQLKDVASLSKQLGGDRLQRLQKQLGQAVQQRTRMEDALIAWQRGYLVLCLPGTRAAFRRHGAAQCGICTPGFLVAAKSLLEGNSDPSETEVRYWLAGNLCRCTGYDKIIRAVLECAADMRGA